MRFPPVRLFIFFAAGVIGVWFVGSLRADIVETTNGARLLGQVVKVTHGKVYLRTDYAGTLVIKQKKITRVETGKPFEVRMKNGRRLHGRISGKSRDLQVVIGSGAVRTTLDRLSAAWPAGKRVPVGIRPDYQWTYEVSVNLNGKTGNHNQLGAAYGAKATLTRLKDTLVLRTNYDRQVTDSVTSADQFRAGADYTNNYSQRNSWYMRDVGGYDRVRDVSAYDTAAVGAGYDFIRSDHQVLTGRSGLAYRYENYTDPENPDLSSVGVDLGLDYTLPMNDARLTARLAVVPTFESVTNVHVTQETDLDLPLAKSPWKLRLGLSNDYASRPANQVKKLDTTYFASFVLSWRH